MRAVGKLEPWGETRKTEPARPVRVLQLPQERNSDYWEKRLLGCRGQELAPAIKEAAVPGNIAAVGALYKLVLNEGLPEPLLEEAAKAIATIASPPLEAAADSFVKGTGGERARAARYMTKLIDRNVDCVAVADTLIGALGNFVPESNGHPVEHLMEARQLAYSLLGQLDRKGDERAGRLERIIEAMKKYEDPRDEEYGNGMKQFIGMLEGKIS